MEYTTIRQYIIDNNLDADPDNHTDQCLIAKHLRGLGYQSHVIREGKTVKRVWIKGKKIKNNDKLEAQLADLVTKGADVTKA